MATILYAAISRDGFIAGKHDETPWSEAEWQAFQAFVQTCDVVLMGRRTFEIMQRDGSFIEGPEYIVVTHDVGLDTDTLAKIVIDAPDDIPEGERIGIIGGGELNGSLAELGVIDEMILDIEPIDLHEGIKLFGSHEPQLRLELIGTRPLGEATIQRRYKILHDTAN